MAAVDVSETISALETTMGSIENVLDLPDMRKRAAVLEEEASAPDLWDDQAKAQVVTSKLSFLQGEIRKAEARFIDRDRLDAGGKTVRAKRFVLATGSRPAVPKIPGLADLPYLTNESVFDLRSLPRHQLVIGGGPIGIELAQAFRHLGSEVTVIEAATILAKDDPELVEVVRTRLLADGIELREGATVEGVERFYVHLEETLAEIGFLKPTAPRQLMTRLRRLFNRVRLDQMELNILRGMLTEIQKSVRGGPRT